MNGVSDVDPFSVVALFAGAGGLDMGFHKQGFNIVWANDIDEDACNTHRKWSNSVVVQADISKIKMEDIPKSGVIIGGFPCQGFSLAGPRKIDDERNTLYKFFVKLVEKNQPYIFVAENVKGILTLGEGLILEAILQDFSDRGYDVYPTLVNAADYGVPQERWRVIMMGFRKDLSVGKYSFPGPLPFKQTIEDALKNIPTPKIEDVCRDSFSSRYMSRNRKRLWNEISYTIPAMGKQVTLHPSSPDMVKIDKDHWIFGKNGETRRLSWQEAAAIQTFPKEMIFEGNLTSKYRQIGNAVPVRLAEVVAIEVRRHLESYIIYLNDAKDMSATQTKNGKGFEYACLQSIKDRLSIMQDIVIEASPAFLKAKNFYFQTEIEERKKMDLAADAATRFLVRYEPRLQYPNDCSPLYITIQSDASGQKGDVRDIICLRKQNEWQIGLSCKHNHSATKHSRLSATIDFGEKWFDRPCSSSYFEQIGPIFYGLNELKGHNVEWSEVEDKESRYYEPVIDAFVEELESLYERYNEEIPRKLIHYLIGFDDFYKIMSKESNCTTEIQAFNINGTLNKSSGNHKSEAKISKVKLPNRIIDIRKKGKNKIIITCDEGWTVSLRIHNAKKLVEPSLKFDVVLEGLPADLGTKIEPW